MGGPVFSAKDAGPPAKYVDTHKEIKRLNEKYKEVSGEKKFEPL
jgi:hypothetical protein